MIAIVAPIDFEGGTLGGTEAVVEEFVSNVSDAAASTILLVGISLRSDDVGRVGTRTIQGRCYDFFAVGITKTDSRKSLRAELLHGLLRHRRALGAMAASVVYAHTPEAALGATWVFRRVPVVLHCHGIDNPLLLSRFPLARSFPLPAAYSSFVMKPALQAAAKVVVTADSRQFREFCLAQGPEISAKSMRVPSMVDLRTFRPSGREHARREAGLASERHLIASVGRLEEPKGVDILIRATKELVATGVDAGLVIVGDGGYRHDLEALAAALGVSDRVRFFGRTERRKIPTVLNACDIFATASAREGISVALLEAMACGLPCVSTTVGGAQEIIKDGYNGFLCRGRNAEEVASAMRRALVNATDLRVGALESAQAYSASSIAPIVLEQLVFLSRTVDRNTRILAQ